MLGMRIKAGKPWQVAGHAGLLGVEALGVRGVGKVQWGWKLLSNGTKTHSNNYKYLARIRGRGLQDPSAHNFPYSFDNLILQNKPEIQTDGSLLFRKMGTLNGVEGFFEIGLNSETKTIFHSTFVKAKK